MDKEDGGIMAFLFHSHHRDLLVGERLIMGIQVQCPHGHVFKVKDKYAGKKGLCPKCDGQVVVLVPDVLSAKETNAAYREAVISEHRSENPVSESHDSSVFDEPAEAGSSVSGSLLGSSVIRHQVKCLKCKQAVPMWYAKCPNCGEFLEH